IPPELCLKSRNSICAAPKARNMIDRGSVRAERGASPLDKKLITAKALKERNTSADISHFQCSANYSLLPGATLRSAQRLPLAIIFRAFGAAALRLLGQAFLRGQTS